MSENKKTVSDVIREYVANTHANDPEYFATKPTRERNQDFQNFCIKNKDTLDYQKHRSVFTEILNSFARDKEIDLPKGTGKKSKPKAEKFQVTKGTQQGQVTVNPKEPRQREPNTANETKQGLQVASQQKGESQQTQLHPPNCQCFECKKIRKEVTEIEPEEAGAILEILIDLWHARNPDVKPMTEQEVIMVGKRLKPIIERHLGGDILMYGLALVTVGKIVTERVSQAKSNTKQKKKPEPPRTPDEPNREQPQQEQQEEPPQPTKRKFFNSKKVNSIIEEGEKDDD